jgi:dihydroorotate dehydrogenase electron transfer subunit
MKEESCIIEENRLIKKKYYLMKINAPHIAEHAKPGQFAMLKASIGIEPLLKRPFGIFDAEPPYVWFYYEVVGRGTELIATLKPGDKTHVLGPLGNGFPGFENKNILVIAGGRGIAPIYFAARHYSLSNRVFLVYGARSADDLNLLDELNTLKLQDMFLYTDDGSHGKKGFITTDIKQIISDNRVEVTASCGPDAMFENLAAEINELDIENYVSLEALMGCGFGICHSCVVKTEADEYKKVCTDGPVFKMEDIAWQTE